MAYFRNIRCGDSHNGIIFDWTVNIFYTFRIVWMVNPQSVQMPHKSHREVAHDFTHLIKRHNYLVGNYFMSNFERSSDSSAEERRWH